jgi:hypothetical protein
MFIAGEKKELHSAAFTARHIFKKELLQKIG